MFEKNLFGLEKNGDIKVWSIQVYMADHVDHTNSQPLISIRHGKEGGKLTTKDEWVFVGKQGRTPYEQAVSQAEGRIKKQMDKNYRETKEELTEVPLLPMLASDYNKVGHRIEFPCYGSVKYDGVRCIASKHAGQVFLISRTGQPYSVPHLEEALAEFMHDGELFDGEIYLHGQVLQDITSATKRTDTQKEIDKVTRDIAKRGHEYRRPSKDGIVNPTLAEELENAELIHRIRPQLQFFIFDIPMDGVFADRLRAMDVIHDERKDKLGQFLEMTDYDIVTGDDNLRAIQHPRAISWGFEGYMLRNKKGVYESGKRSGDLQKFKTFMDSEFLILDIVEDKQGNAVFVLKNDINDLTFQCVMGDMGERKVFLLQKGTLKGKFLNVKFQTRYKGSLLPQFGVGQYIREGYLVEGTFIPYD
jgi:DNA ligase-1